MSVSCRILHVCHGVMYKQLGAWLLHGLLLDYYGEFFIIAKTAVQALPDSNSDVDTPTEAKQLQQVCIG